MVIAVGGGGLYGGTYFKQVDMELIETPRTYNNRKINFIVILI